MKNARNKIIRSKKDIKVMVFSRGKSPNGNKWFPPGNSFFHKRKLASFPPQLGWERLKYVQGPAALKY